MENHIKKVNQNPFSTDFTFYVAGSVVGFVFYPVCYVVGNGFDLRATFAFANDKIFRRGIVDPCKIDDDYFFTFDVLNSVYNKIEKGFFWNCRLFGLSLCLYQNIWFIS